jgi:hypothetical protein
MNVAVVSGDIRGSSNAEPSSAEAAGGHGASSFLHVSPLLHRSLKTQL